MVCFFIVVVLEPIINVEVEEKLPDTDVEKEKRIILLKLNLWLRISKKFSLFSKAFFSFFLSSLHLRMFIYWHWDLGTISAVIQED